MFDVRRLTMLAALERLGTVAAVADEFHLTPPAASMQLAALEREAGVVLTERRGRRLALTPAGTALAAHGRELADRLSLADLEIDALRRGAAGRYRVAAFPSAARTVVAGAWSRLSGDTAGIELELITAEPEDALAALAAGEVDLAIVHSYSSVPRRMPDDVVVDPLLVEGVRLAVRREDPLAAALGPIALDRVRDRAWIAPARALTCFDMVDRACGLAGFRPSVVAETSDFAVQLALVEAGVGVALVPDLAVDPVPPGIRMMDIEPSVTRAVVAVRRVPRRADAALDRIVGALAAATRSR